MISCRSTWTTTTVVVRHNCIYSEQGGCEDRRRQLQWTIELAGNNKLSPRNNGSKGTRAQAVQLPARAVLRQQYLGDAQQGAQDPLQRHDGVSYACPYKYFCPPKDTQ